MGRVSGEMICVGNFPHLPTEFYKKLQKVILNFEKQFRALLESIAATSEIEMGPEKMVLSIHPSIHLKKLRVSSRATLETNYMYLIYTICLSLCECVASFHFQSTPGWIGSMVSVKIELSDQLFSPKFDIRQNQAIPSICMLFLSIALATLPLLFW